MDDTQNQFINVRFKATGQTGKVPADKFDPSLFDRVDDTSSQPTAPSMAPDQPTAQPNPIMDALGTLGRGAQTAYNFLKPKYIAANVEPIAQSAAQSIGILPSLINSLMKGQSATPEERQNFQQQWGNYITGSNKTNAQMAQNSLVPNFISPALAAYGDNAPPGPSFNSQLQNMEGIASDVGKYVLPGQILGPVSSALGNGLLPWIASRALTGAATGGITGMMEPKDTMGERINNAGGSALSSAVLFPLVSGAVNAISQFPGGLANSAKNLFGMQYPTIDAPTLGAIAQQNQVATDLMKNTTGVMPDTMESQIQDQLKDLGNQVQDQLQSIKTPLSTDEISDRLNNVVKSDIQGWTKENLPIREEYAKMIDKIYSQFGNMGQIRPEQFINGEPTVMPMTAMLKNPENAELVKSLVKANLDEGAVNTNSATKILQNLLENAKDEPLVKSLVENNPNVPAEYIDLVHPPVVQPVEPTEKGTLQNLFKGKQELGKYMDTNKAWDRLFAGNANTTDVMGMRLYNEVKNIIDEKVQGHVANQMMQSTPGMTEEGAQQIAKMNPLSALTEKEHNLQMGGRAVVQGVKSQGGPPRSIIDMRMPGIRMVLPFLGALQNSALRGAYNAGSAGNAVMSNPATQALMGLIKAGSIGNNMNAIQGALTPQAQPDTMRVIEKSSGKAGTIPANEYDPNLYEPLNQ